MTRAYGRIYAANDLAAMQRERRRARWAALRRSSTVALVVLACAVVALQVFAAVAAR